MRCSVMLTSRHTGGLKHYLLSIAFTMVMVMIQRTWFLLHTPSLVHLPSLKISCVVSLKSNASPVFPFRHARLVIAAVHLALTDRCSPCRWPNNSSGHQNKAWWTFKYSGGAKQMLGGHEIEGTYPVEYRPEESEQAILRAKLNRQLLQAGL